MGAYARFRTAVPRCQDCAERSVPSLAKQADSKTQKRARRKSPLMSPTTAEESLTPDTALATFAAALRDAISALYPQAPETPVNFEAPRRPEFGDFATNAAFGLTRIARKSPQDIA